MVAVRKILFPVDFSERSLGAGRYVQAMAEHFGAEVVLLHTVEPFSYDSSVLDKMAVRKMELQLFLAAEFRSLRVKRLVLEGDPTRRIGEIARTENVDLIMMPTHGWGVYRRFILGSVTAKVLHDAPRPVWTCGHAEEAPLREQLKFDRILCAIDLGPKSARVLGWARDLAESYGAELTVAHVCQTIEAGAAALAGHDVTPLLLAKARSGVASLCDDLGISSQSQIVCGDVAQSLQRAARESHSSMMVIGRSTDEEFLGRLGANCYSIIRQAPCPVISV
jgi:nucleotide-binding universal stress UspA family protein